MQKAYILSQGKTKNLPGKTKFKIDGIQHKYKSGVNWKQINMPEKLKSSLLSTPKKSSKLHSPS